MKQIFQMVCSTFKNNLNVNLKLYLNRQTYKISIYNLFVIKYYLFLVEYEEATTSNKEDNLQFLDNLQHSNNLVDNISSKLVANLRYKYYEFKIFTVKIFVFCREQSF
jgi:hypothetical protein